MAATAQLESVISAAHSPDAEISDIAGMVEVVPGLSDAVRRYARLFYERQQQDWMDGGRTLLLLGPRVVAEVATQQAVVTAVEAMGLPQVVLQTQWLDALRRAASARVFAERFERQVGPDHAFTAALCLELGLLQQLKAKGGYSGWYTRVREHTGHVREQTIQGLIGIRASEGFGRFASALGLRDELVQDVMGKGTGDISTVLTYAARFADAMGSSNAGPMLEDLADDLSVELFCAVDEVWEIFERLEGQLPEIARALGVTTAYGASLDVLEERTGSFQADNLEAEELVAWTRILESQVMALEKMSGSLADRLEQAHGRDPLTGLMSHRMFLEVLEREVANARVQGRHCWVLVVDVDQFTKLNRYYGYYVGDQVLEGVVAVLRKMHPDARALARVGADSFAILVDMDDWRVRVVGERLRAAIETLRFPEISTQLRVTATVVGVGLDSIADSEGHGGLLAAAYGLLHKFQRQGNQTVWPQ